jgi:hypothetical protein
MPVPSIEEWEWLNWKFPRPIHAGDTIFARWTLTQKRPPIGGATSAIVVWRVDVHTSDGALCAEGEVGAKVRRDAAGRQRAHVPTPGVEVPVPPPAAASRRRRRRRGSNGSTLPEAPAVAAPPAPAAKPERVAGPSRRRRRRRPSGQGAREDHEPRAAHAPETAPPPVNTPPPAPAPARTKGGLGNVIRRLRRSGQD